MSYIEPLDSRTRGGLEALATPRGEPFVRIAPSVGSTINFGSHECLDNALIPAGAGEVATRSGLAMNCAALAHAARRSVIVRDSADRSNGSIVTRPAIRSASSKPSRETGSSEV